MSRPPAPCHECGNERPGGLHGKRRGRVVPLCGSCKARTTPVNGGGNPKWLPATRIERLNAILLRPLEVPAWQ